MTNAWNQAKDLADRASERGGMFVRLKNNGDKVVGAFVGDPYAKEVCWTGQKYEEYNDKDPAHKDAKASLRVSLNFFVPAEDKMKVIEGGAGFFKSILKVKDKYGVENWLFEIERQGEANDPKTKYSILPEGKISADVQAQMSKAKQHDLAALSRGEGESERSPNTNTASTGTISETEALRIVERLKLLPKSDVTAFLTKFGIARIRDIKAGDLRAANAVLDELTGTGQPAREVDPFA